MTFFGDITEPTSRALFEDWDWYEMGTENDSNETKLQWQVPLDNLPERVDKFYIFEGKSLWSGVRAKEDIVEVNSVKEATLNLYKSPKSNNFVAVVKHCDLLTCNSVVRLLKDVITRSKTVVTVQEKSISEFQTNRPITTLHVMRKIVTTNKVNLIDENVLKLEQPNLITGVSAGVFSLREHLGLSATSIVIFMEPQEIQVDDIENLLTTMNMSGAVKMSPNAVANSNLYV